MSHTVYAELVANVLTVVANPDDEVSVGDTLVLLESMKMEIPVVSEVAGRVTSIDVAVGDVIQEGDVIAVIEVSD